MSLEEVYEIIRRYRSDVRLQFNNVCDAQGNGQDHRHKLADCRLKSGVYTTLDALSYSPDALEKRLQTRQSLKQMS